MKKLLLILTLTTLLTSCGIELYDYYPTQPYYFYPRYYVPNYNYEYHYNPYYYHYPHYTPSTPNHYGPRKH